MGTFASTQVPGTYGSALLEHVEAPSEESLARAYDLGREALEAGRGVLEVVELHHRAMGEARRAAGAAADCRRIEDRAAAFLTEALAPFEIAERGYREANQGLIRLNEELGRRAAELAAANETIRADEERASFLAGASQELGSSLGAEETLRTVARIPVQLLADWCLVECQVEGGFHEVAIAIRTDDGERLRRTRHHAEEEAPSPPCALHLDEGPGLPAGPPPYLAAAFGPGLPGDAAWLALPLQARDKRSGTLLLLRTGPPFDPGDRALAREFAFRAALALDNARLYREATAAVRLRDDFLSIACHELRTPLTPLAASLASGERRLRRGESLEPDFFDAANRQVRQLARVTKQMLDASLLQAGDVALARDRVELGALVREVAAALEPLGPRHRLEVLADGVATVRGDGRFLRQVVLGLLDNAVKFSPSGGDIAVRVDRRDGRVVISVADPGIGIPEAQLGAVFQGFFRASNVPVRSRGGLGLGLFVIRAIVERHGGRIGVESREGQGSVFTVELPATDDEGS